MTSESPLAETSRLMAQGHGDRFIAGHFNITRHQARNLMREAERGAVVVSPGMTPLARYEAARRALADAVRVDEVMEIRDLSERLKLAAKQARDFEMEANAIELRERAERRLGIMLAEQKAAGGFAKGGRPKTTSAAEGVSPPITLADMDIDHKLSHRAQRKAGIAEQAFEAMVAAQRERILARGAVDLTRDISTEGKKERRAARERILGGIQHALPAKRYGVILADPEWRFEPWSRQTGMDRAADNHYPTSCTEVIAARDVPSIAAPDCVLFLWATAPMLPHALLVMSAWGFDYRSHVIWQKDRIGTGYWFRNAHELLLVGVKGNIPAPAMGTQAHSVIAAEVGAHSAKPESFLELIEEYFPTLPKIELNRRGPARPGWDAWGNEADPPHDPETGEIIEAPSEAA